jgi:hypothetical protein
VVLNALWTALFRGATSLTDVWFLAGYAFFIGVVLVTAALRREPTALRGRSWFILTAVAAGLWFGALVYEGRRPSMTAIAIVVALLLISFALRSRWLVARATPEVVDESITGSARRLLLVCEGTPGNRRIVCTTVVLDVRSTPFGWLGTQVTLPALPRDKKLDLFRRLLGKQYKNAVPLPPIRL